MIDPSVIDEPADENTTEAEAPPVYNIGAYMHAGRTCDGVIRVLEQMLGTDPHELSPLYTAVDCDALDQLFRPDPNGRTRPGVSLTFTYDGYAVTLTGDGHLAIQA